MPALSYIVSSYNRPYQLTSMLCDLIVQRDQDFEVLVMDNSNTAEFRAYHRKAVENIADPRFRYYSHAEDYPEVDASGAYKPANWGAQKATGEFLCFPSEDCYYSPQFGNLMLKIARANQWDLVICDCVYDCDAWRNAGQYPMGFPQNFIVGGVDKAGFIVRRSRFPGFPDGNQFTGLDGLLIEQLVREGVSHGKIPALLYWHN